EEEEGETLQKLEYQAGEEPAARAAERRSEDEGKPVRPDSQVGPARMLELLPLSVEGLQTSPTRRQSARYPPALASRVHTRLCRFFDFQRAPELIELGRIVARDTLDRFEAGEH